MRSQLKLGARVVFVIIATLACNVDQPLPPANNPATVKLGCFTNTECASGTVCHSAISGGTCLAACTADATCAAIQSGLVCHTELNGGTCAPDCSLAVLGRVGDGICASYGPNIACQAGRCVDIPAPTTAYLRVFNALTEHTTIAVTVDDATVPFIGGVALGNVEPQTAGAVAAGTHTYHVADSAALLDTPRELLAGHHYILVVHETTAGNISSTWIDEDLGVAPPPQMALVVVANTAPGLPPQDFHYAPTGGSSQVLAGAVDTREVRITNAPAVAGTLAVSQALHPEVTMFSATTLVDTARYVALLWGGRRQTYVETALISATGIMSRLPTSGFRLANATVDLATVVVSIDEATSEATRSQGPQTTGPIGSGLLLVAPGTHRVRLWRDVVGGAVFFDQTTNFVGRESYTLVAHGTLADAAKPLSALVIDNAPGAGLTNTQATLRVVHAVSAQLGTAGDASQTIGANPPTTVSPGLAYGTVSGPLAIEVAEAFTLSLDFGSGAPSQVASAALSVAPGDVLLAIASGDAATFSFWVLGPKTTIQVNP